MNVYHMSGKIQLYTVHAKWSGITTDFNPFFLRATNLKLRAKEASDINWPEKSLLRFLPPKGVGQLIKLTAQVDLVG